MKKSVNKVTAIIMIVIIVALTLPVDKGSRVNAGKAKQIEKAGQASKDKHETSEEMSLKTVTQETPTITPMPTMMIVPDMAAIKMIKDGVIYAQSQVSFPVAIENYVESGERELILQETSLNKTENYAMTQYQWQDTGMAIWDSKIADGQKMMIQETYRFQVKSQEKIEDARDITIVWDNLSPEIILSDKLEELVKLQSQNITLHYEAKDSSYHSNDKKEIQGVGVEKVYAEFESSIAGVKAPKTVETSSKDSITLEFEENTEFHGICRLYAVDYLGNVSTPIEVELHIDKTKPQVLITEGRSQQWEEEMTIKAKVSDYCFPENMEQVFWYVTQDDTTPQYDGITWEKNEQESSEYQQIYNLTIAISKEKYLDFNGNFTICAKDAVGNVQNTKSADNEFQVMFDSTAPEFQGVTITDEERNSLESLYNKLSFGIFFKDKIRIEVDVADIKVNNACSGISDLVLMVDGQICEPIQLQGMGTEACKAIYVLEKEKKYTSFEFTAKDIAGNSTQKSMNDMNSLLDTPEIYIDGTNPTLLLEAQEKGINKYKDKENRNWYQKDIQFHVVAGDNLAGIQKIEVEINGKKLTQDVEGKMINEALFQTQRIMRKEFTISTSQVSSQKASQGGEDGRYDLEIQITDNSGNTITKSQTVYLDTTSPSIKSIEVLGNGSLDGNGKITSETTYGYFVVGTAELLVSAEDNNGSAGIKNITYYTINYSNSKQGVISAEKKAVVDKNGQAKIKLSDDFRGVVYVRAVDNVKNIGNEYKRLHYIITGNQQKHEKNSDIEIILPETLQKDTKGNPLYSQNVTAKIKVKDADMGIEKIVWSVISEYDTSHNQQGSITVNEKGKISDTSIMQAITKEKNIVTEVEGELQITHDSNQICVVVEFTDKAGMTRKKEIYLSIDKQKPVIEVTYDNQNHQESYLGEGEYFKEDRTATIVVQERNFETSKIQVKITNEEGEIPSTTSWEKTENTKNPDQSSYTAKVPFTTDGKYTLEVMAEDSAGNQAEAFQGTAFIIDKTKPVTKVTWNDVVPFRDSYYKDSRTATVTITEHNFDGSKVELTATTKKAEETSALPKLSSFRSNGDIHTATIEFVEDGTYSFEISYMDKAGNNAEIVKEESFCIDKTEPELFFEGVEDKGAYKEEVSPVIVCKDENLDVSTLKTQITMINCNNATVEVEDALLESTVTGDTFMTPVKNPEQIKENDGIYAVTASITDMAGNIHEETLVYSVNRFGSVYTLPEETKKVAGNYLKSSQEISIMETNTDEIRVEDVKVKLTKNGEATQLTEGKDYTRTESGSDGNWKQYTYTIAEENFKEDGVYMVSVSSKDKAGNYNENTADSEENVELWFAVDKTEPVIVPLNFQEQQSYNMNSLEAELEVQDNLKLSEVKVFVNEEEVELKQNEEQERYTFHLKESTKAQNIRIVVADAAGNEMIREVEGIYITTNPWVRFVHNKKAVAVATAGTVLLILMVAGLLVRRAKKKGGNQ